MRLHFILLAVLCNVAFAATTRPTNGSRSDVQAKLDLSSAGDTVTLPAGSFTWDGGVTNTVGANIRGAGGSRIVARSRSSVEVGTGSKSFTLLSARSKATLASYISFTVGQTVRVHRTGGSTSLPGGSPVWMLGTVASYNSGTSVLTVTVTSTSATAGTHDIWIIEAVGATRITADSGTEPPISVTESASAYVTISGITFEYGTGSAHTISVTTAANGLPVIVHDCGFYSSFPYPPGIDFLTNRGLVYNCSFWATVFSVAPVPITVKAESFTTSWSTTSTMGAADVTGQRNVYVESCDFHAFLNATDYDDNARTVTRWCMFNNAGAGTHGADSSVFGMRHSEFYDNEHIFDDMGSLTFNLTWWMFFRGGTGVVTDNIIPLLNSSEWGDKPDIYLQIQNLNRNQWGIGGQVLQSVSVANPTVVTTKAPHGFTTGEVVIISDSTTTPTIDGERTITVTGSTTFTIPVNVTVGATSAAEGLMDIGGLRAKRYTITGATAAASSVVTTFGNHGLTSGNYVRITGSDTTPSIDGYRQATVLSSTTFSIPVTVSVAGTAGFTNRVDYYAPRQVGQGRITGMGVDGFGNSTFLGVYVGDIEPLYIWGNTGTGGNTDIQIGDAAAEFVRKDPDLKQDYIQAGRDYIVDVAKPGYQKYTYPHPLREMTLTVGISGKATMSGKATLR